MDVPFSYDVLAYPSKFFLQTHPDRLATLATLFGMTPQPVENCRVFELGCGNGSNLISQAFGLPDAQFIGIDLGEKHIEEAKRSAAELGLSNIEFHSLDLMDLSTADFGKFDYITAHGLFSWVPEPVRIRTLSLFREMLNENGIGYISYSAFPGAHHRQMVQEIMRFHTRDISEPAEKVEKAISFLSFLTENTSERGVFGRILQHDHQRHNSHDAADIFHDDLSDMNRAFYFHEFAKLLNDEGLQYLAEAELHAMGTHGLSADAKAFIESVPDIVEKEQYLDFLRGRIFRQTLFCHKEIELQRNPSPDVIDKFLFASSVEPQSTNIDLASQKNEKFIGFRGVGIEIDEPMAKAALFYLGTIWGRRVKFAELIENAKALLEERGFSTDDWEQHIDTCRKILLQICLGTNIVELHISETESFMEVSLRPEINALSLWQLQNADNILTQLNIDMKIEDKVSRHLLELLDGTRNKLQLLPAMKDFIRKSDGIEDKPGMLNNLPGWLDESLIELARVGLFKS